MRQAHDVDTVRAAEAALMTRVPDGALMQRAAAGLASVCADLLAVRRGGVYGARVVVLAGSGDNGGDALYAAARLGRRGARVDVLRAGSRVHEAGLAAVRAAGGRVAPDPEDEDALAVLDDAALVLDGLVGIGGRGGLRPAAAALARRAADGPGVIVAVDLPSGVDASTGEVEGAAVRADVTVTFGTWKPGLLVDPGAAYAGAVELVGIGLEGDLPAPAVEALQADDVADLLPAPGRESDKYRRGVVGIVAGSGTYTGAALLSVGAAAAAGAGMVRYSGPRQVADLVRAHRPEVVVHEGDPDAAGRVQAWVVGPGIGTDAAARTRLEQVLASDVPVLVDADGLTVLGDILGGPGGGGRLDRSAPTLLTPHAGELARLTGADRDDVEARRLHHASAAAAALGATVLLKGSTTVVAETGAPVYANPTGTGELATAGTGDVLSGLCGALLAQGLAPRDAGAVGAYLHGLAARLAGDGGPVPAGGLVPYVGEAWRTVTG